MKMKAAVLYETQKPLVIVADMSVPEPEYGQVLVKIMASGVCHKQLEEIQGKRGIDPYLPHLLGHEGSGIVEAIGDGVTTVNPGDHVVLSWIKGTGIQSETPMYLHDGQTINAGWITTFNEYVVASENRVTAIRKDMPFDVAALLGCAVPTGAGAIFNQSGGGSGETFVVFGAGGIGLNAIQAAASLDSRLVIAVDVDRRKLERAREFGATDVINAEDVDPVAAIREMTGGPGADVAFEATGRPSVMEQAFEAASVTGVCIVAGVPPHDSKMSIDSYQLNLGKRLIGTAGGASSPARDYPRYAELYLKGEWKLDELITHRFQLTEINDAIAALEQGELGRAVITFDSSTDKSRNG